jgi:hypothetical protein
MGAAAQMALCVQNVGNDANTLILLHMDGADLGTTFTDSSATGNTVTATGGVVTSSSSFAAPNFGRSSGKFPASGGLTVPDSAALRPGTGDFTVECWVRYNAGSVAQVIYEKGLNTANSILIQTDTSASPKITVLINASSVVTETTGTATGVWVHKAIVRSSGTVTIYSNGAANGSASGAATITVTSTIGIGCRADGVSAPLNGNLDELRYSNIARWTANFTPRGVPYS